MGALALILGAVVLVGMAVTVGIGYHVVKRFPNEHDPRRNRKRYVRSAMVALGLAVAALVGLLALLVIAIVQAAT